MIPKIIHYCWLSGDPYPSDIQSCIDTWRQHLSDYEIWLWGKISDEDFTKMSSSFTGFKIVNFDIASTKWTEQAFKNKKYAFAADYIRLYALYTYGGIYLDSAVIVYKAFGELLHLPYFIGHDQINAFEAAIIGSEPKCGWIKDMIDSYEGKEFVGNDGHFDMLPLPCRFHHVLTGLGYRFRKITTIETYHQHERQMFVFDKDFFNSRNAIEVCKTKKSFCAHNYAGSWNKKKSRKTIKDLLPKSIIKMIYIIGQKTWARNKYSWFQIPFDR